jgi:hypothetical protein
VDTLASFGRLEWTAIMAVWLLASFGSGYLLARFFKRLHPALSLRKLWAFWTVILTSVAGVVFALRLI